MGKSVMHFLALKPWHPSNMRNQRKIWTAEQKALQREKDEYEARRELEREERRMKEQQLAAARGDQDAIKEINKHQMTFMYAPPPGFEGGGPGAGGGGGVAGVAGAGGGAPGVGDAPRGREEDEAVRAFKRELVRQDPNFSANRISKLELAVGRKEKKGLTFDELVERHPELKNAPVEGHFAKNVMLQFKPFGKMLSNKRCFRCGEFGHSTGDRACKMSGVLNPSDEARLAIEDPLSYMKHRSQRQQQQSAADVGGTGAEAGAGATGAAGAGAFLATLSKQQRKVLLRQLSKVAGGNDDSSSSSASSASSSSDSDDGGGGCGGQKKRRKQKHRKHKRSTKGGADKKSSKKHKKSKSSKKAKKHKARARKHSNSSDARDMAPATGGAGLAGGGGRGAGGGEVPVAAPAVGASAPDTKSAAPQKRKHGHGPSANAALPADGARHDRSSDRAHDQKKKAKKNKHKRRT